MRITCLTLVLNFQVLVTQRKSFMNFPTKKYIAIVRVFTKLSSNFEPHTLIKKKIVPFDFLYFFNRY